MKKCRKGLHLFEGKQCRECAKPTKRAYWLSHKKQHAESEKKYRHRHRERKNLATRRSKYGITKEQLEQMLKHQNDSCATCGRKESIVDVRTGRIKSLSIDHCHKTGKIRGLLCDRCNRAIGYLREDIKTAIKIARYLTRANRTILVAASL